MKLVVVDSSVLVKWLNQKDEELLEQANQVLRDVMSGKVKLICPELSKYEVGNALLRKELDSSQIQETIRLLYRLPITFVPESILLATLTHLVATGSDVTYYDAAFIALAKHQNAMLVTDNLKHQGKTTDVKVIALQDY